MIKKILLFTVLSFLVVGTALATTAKDKSYGLASTSEIAGLSGTGAPTISTRDPVLLASDIIAVGLSFLGIVFFLLIFYAGIRWMTAMGASDKVDKAKDMLEGAGIGLLITIASYALAKFIFTNLGIGS